MELTYLHFLIYRSNNLMLIPCLREACPPLVARNSRVSRRWAERQLRPRGILAWHPAKPNRFAN